MSVCSSAWKRTRRRRKKYQITRRDPHGVRPLIASLKNKDFISYFTNKLKGRAKEKGIGTKMRVKLAAKLLVIAWTLMRKKEFFDPKYLKQVDPEMLKKAA